MLMIIHSSCVAQVGISDWKLGPRLGYLHNDNHKHTKITSLEYLKTHDNTLLMCDDNTLLMCGSGRYLGLGAGSKTGVPS